MKLKRIAVLLLIAVLAFSLCGCGRAKADHFIKGLGLGSTETQVTGNAINYYLAMASTDSARKDEYLSLFEEHPKGCYFGLLGDYKGMVEFNYSDSVADTITFTYMEDDLRGCFEYAYDFFTKNYGPAESGAREDDTAAWSKDGINVSLKICEETVQVIIENR